jgi:hypothetical protein
MSTLAPLLESFFIERLAAQRQASPNTIAAYRDTWRQLLCFAQARTGKTPSLLGVEDLDAALIGDFLHHLEHERGVTVRTRNARLTAIRAVFHHAAYRHPEHAASIQRVLAIPAKRTVKAIVTYLDDAEMRACSPPLTEPTGSAAGTTRCSSWPWKPECGPANSPASPATRSSSAQAPTSAATAKAARNGSRHCDATPEPLSPPGSPNSAATQNSPSSPAPRAAVSAETPSAGSSNGTSPQPQPRAHRFRPRTLRHTRCGTAAP